MAEYTVEIREIIASEISVTADSPEEAQKIVRNQYINGEYDDRHGHLMGEQHTPTFDVYDENEELVLEDTV